MSDVKIMNDKIKALEIKLTGYKCVAVAFSGGVDSTFLLKSALQALRRDNVYAIIAQSPIFPVEEFERASAICREWDVSFTVIMSDEMADERFVANSTSRCYFCKIRLFTKIRQAANAAGITVILEGSNADDVNDYRPGFQAIKELCIESPLLACGISKAEIREGARMLQLDAAEKPSMACLSSRIPYGVRITAENLAQVHQGEQIIREYGITQCRVRHYGDCARIEVMPCDIMRLADKKIREELCQRFHAIGYVYVTLDLEGYRTGSMNLVHDHNNTMTHEYIMQRPYTKGIGDERRQENTNII